MKRLFLFSSPMMKDEFAKFIFPEEIKIKRFAYMPTNGHNDGDQWVSGWEEYAKVNNAEFVFIDNSLLGEQAKLEAIKLLSCNILMSTGGNTFDLLFNLRESNLFETVKEFITKDEFVLTGFSAGSIIMTPTIAVAGQPAGTDPEDLFDENRVGITDLTALNIVAFEVYPHYDDSVDRTNIDTYRKKTSNEVKPIADDAYILIEF